jgi:hypothetical protein
MIVGYFAPDGSPYAKARVNLPRIGVIGNVNFLVDTGTDTTILHPFDAGDLHCHFDELSNPVVATSAGGQHTYYTEPAVVSFYDGETRHDFRTNIQIGKSHPVTDALDSLLGRDVLSELEMEYAPRRGRLSFRLDEDR